MAKVTGGKSVYGANLGIIMLEAQFPRIYGDMGNAETWPFPVQYRVVKGASPDEIVRNDPMDMADKFVTAALDLVEHGCDGITTNCGFLALIQEELQNKIPVPIATSSLMQIPMVQPLLPKGKRVGVITISKNSLSEAHLTAAGAPLDTPIVGTDGKREFTTGILDNHLSIDFEASRLDMLDAADDLLKQNDDIGAIVLECTNMIPYANDIRKHTGLPVFSIYNLVDWFYLSLKPRKFDLTLDDPRYS